MPPFAPPLQPMLSKGKDQIPRGAGWVYEPKWDGFRVIAFLSPGEDPYLCSRNGQPLQRYFPELLPMLREALPPDCVVDGEIIVATERGLDFDRLQMRLHPAASRVNRLAAETPAAVVLFDILAEGARDLRPEPFAVRREALRRALHAHPSVRLTPQTSDPEEAESWFLRYEGAGCDGVVAKTVDQVYAPGKRTMIKIKHARTVDCVVGGYRESKDDAVGTGIGSLLLGLYDDAGVFHFVGHTSSFSVAERREVREKLQPLVEPSGFGEGRTPGGPSRWSAGKDLNWTQVRPALVCEVSFEKLQSGRFRHASRFLRWRTDKDPSECDFAQLEPPQEFSLDAIFD
ncbi:MAG: ATP-dependent DNA ligase [Candidatus Dormibacteraeota bacterium]|nr:ATP-dependent DNA ligase [Candidatus Dormibacteraeota bacterium]